MNEAWLQIKGVWHQSIFMSIALTFFNSWDYIKNGSYLLVILNLSSTVFFIFYLLFILAAKIGSNDIESRGSSFNKYTRPFMVANIFWLICFSLVFLGSRLFLDRSDTYYWNLFIMSITVFNSVAIVDLLKQRGLKSEALIRLSGNLIHR